MAYDDFNGSGPGGSWVVGDNFRSTEITKIGDNFKQLSTLQYMGAGSPEGVVTAVVGAVYRRTDGSTGTTLYVKESGVSNTGWRALGVVPTQLLLSAIVTLTDSQIKASPTTDVDLIAAPGSGFTIKVVSCRIKWVSTSGAYTNINTTSSYIVLTCGGKEVSNRLANDSATSVTFLTDLLGTAQNKYTDLIVPPSPMPSVANLPSQTDIENAALKFHAFNNGSGAFTGGNGSNFAKVTLSYMLEAV